MKLILLFTFFFQTMFAHAAEPVSNVVLAIHGGTSDRIEIPPALEKAVLEGLEQALKAGYQALQEKGKSLDAVEAAVRSLENNPLFNAGKGAVFTREGKNELDASIMDGETMKGGAVASVTTIKNPVSAARAVMEKTKHVILVADGAEKFAAKAGLEIVKPSYFFTDRRWKEHLDDLKQSEKKTSSQPKRRYSLGTTGAVALDSKGNLAAATSTGGLTNKMHGRVGDSPILGAGTLADNSSCAVSTTGTGEYFIRYSVAHEISSLIRYKGLNVSQAADEMIQNRFKQVGVDGAAIVLDPKGNLSMSFNSERLPRGYVTRDGKIHVLIQ
jgi:L-asparaginase / beta-aspartyl-peptidase